MDLTRRKTLLATSTALGLAGCIDDLPSSTDDKPNNDDKPNDDDGTNDDPDDVGHDVFQLGHSQAQPLWTTDADATGFITRLDAEDDAVWMVENPEEVDGLQSWLAETDFSQSTIVYVETAAPNTCYTELGVSNVGIEDDRVVGRAEAVDTSGENGACGQAETHPSAFVRVSSDDIPGEAAFTVVDGWGDASEVTTDGLYIDPAGLPGHVQPDGDPRKLEAFSCENTDFRRLEGPNDEVALGEALRDDHLAFAMRVHATGTAKPGGQEAPPQFGRGDEVRVTLWNISTDVQLTGNRHKWNLQILTMDGWQDVRGTTGEESVGYDDVALEHRPGKAFEWTFEMTEAGVLEGHVHEEHLAVCPDLQPGRYRFVYNGIVSGEPLAVEFNYEGE